MKTVAYIFKDVGGWYVCDDSAGYLDTRGRSYRSKREAIGIIRALGDYTHYRTGTSKIRKL